MSITSGLAPIRNYANGGDVNTERQNMLAKLGFPSGITNEQLDAAIAKEKNAAYLPESQAPGATVGQLPGLFKENVFDPTDPVDILTLPFLSAKAAKLAGKAGKKVYDTVRGSGGKVRENLRGIGAYVGADMIADEIRDDSDPFFTKQEDGTYVSTRPLPDAQDEAQEDLEDANKKEEEDKEEKTFEDYMSQLGDFQSMLDPGQMTGGTFIKGSGISTPEIKRYEGGGIANMMPIGMAEGGGIDFSKLGSLGGMPDTPTMSTGSAIAPANINIPEIKQGNPEALKDAEEDFDKFKTDVKSNYVNFADGGIAKFALGGKATKEAFKKVKELAKDKLDKRAKDKAAKAKAKAKAKADKDKAAKAKADADAKETGVTKDKPVDPRDSYIPEPLQPMISGAAAIGKKVFSPSKYSPDTKQQIGASLTSLTPAAIGASVLNAYDPLGLDKPKDNNNNNNDDSSDAAPVNIQESNAMKDILYQNSLERATSAGRTEPSFMDYLASFPGSYTEKVGKDPEFARQMMAGFMAMMKPSEGYVPRNALVDFGEAAYAEQARQEDARPDQLQLIEELSNNPELLESFTKFNRATNPLGGEDLATEIDYISSLIKESLYGDGATKKPILKLGSTEKGEATPLSKLEIYQMYQSLPGTPSERLSKVITQVEKQA